MAITLARASALIVNMMAVTPLLTRAMNVVIMFALNAFVSAMAVASVKSAVNAIANATSAMAVIAVIAPPLNHALQAMMASLI